jgi:hypothetical protein
MKNKFVLTEEESKRILTLHKKKIQEQISGLVPGETMMVSTNLVSEVRNSSTSYTLGSDKYFLESSDVGQPELKFFKGATFKIDGRGILKAKTKYQFVDTWSGEVYGIKDELIQFGSKNMPISKNKNLKYANPETIDGTITYSCDQGKFFTDYNVELLYYDDEGGITPPLRKLCKASKTGESPTPSPTTSKCPKIVKKFTENGYKKIDKQRYDQLANDNTRIRKYEWCPEGKVHLYFAKIKVAQGGGNTPRGNRYGFNYQEALNALKSKGCKTSGGGSSEEDSFVDDWRTNQDQTQTVDTTVSKETILNWAS